MVARCAASVRRMLTAPGQFRFARAYIAGDIDVVDHIYRAPQLQEWPESEGLAAHRLVTPLRILLEAGGEGRPIPPPEEVRVRGRLRGRRSRATATARTTSVSRFWDRPWLCSCAMSCPQHAGFDARNAQMWHEYHALTLSAWVGCLRRLHEEAVTLVAERPARIWPLYIAGSTLAVEAGDTKVSRVIAGRSNGNRSRKPLRPGWG